MQKKAQTSSEYMVIVAVVIIIGLIVVSVLGGIPGIGGNVGKNTNDAELMTKEIGIVSYAITDSSTIINVKNNKNEMITITALRVDGVYCDGFSDDITLGVGQKKKITCTNTNSSSGDTIGDTLPLRIEYTSALGAGYTTDYGKEPPTNTYFRTTGGTVTVGLLGSSRIPAESIPSIQFKAIDGKVLASSGDVGSDWVNTQLNTKSNQVIFLDIKNADNIKGINLTGQALTAMYTGSELTHLYDLYIENNPLLPCNYEPFWQISETTVHTDDDSCFP